MEQLSHAQHPQQPKVDKYLNREQIAREMELYLYWKDIDTEIDPEKVVEVPSDGCDGHMELGPWKTWCARVGEYLLVAIDSDGVEPTIAMY